jgi:branched-chain amino acid transport system substrate-binding protein
MGSGRGRGRGVVALGVGVVAATLLVACSEPEPDATPAPSDSSAPATDSATPATDDTGATGTSTAATTPDTTTGSSATAVPSDGSVVSAYAGEEWFAGTIPAGATAADADAEPILVGMINQEDTPLGSFPELRNAALAAATWVNTELGGVGGRPIEIRTCITSFNVEQSQSCAQDLVQQGVVAFVGGIDVTSNGAYPVIEQNGLSVIGGVPTNLTEQRSPNAFFFSGGVAGAIAAFMEHAASNGAERVALAYGEFESFEVAAREYGAAVGESLGLDVELVPFSLVATDFLPVLTKARDVDADAVMVLSAGSSCVPVMDTAVGLDLDAQLYLTGACAAEEILDAAGDAADGVIFNSEGPFESPYPEADLYADVTDRYAPGPAGGAGTVGFRGFMNLWSILDELGPDGVTADSIATLARSAVERPSFWGHPATCDGQQVPGLPALCAPQQTLFVVPPGGTATGITDWIDTVELLRTAG